MFVDRKLTQDEVSHMQKPLELDLIAYYKIVNEAVIQMLTESVINGLTPDQAITEIEELL